MKTIHLILVLVAVIIVGLLNYYFCTRGLTPLFAG
jgi:hypothetical protein